MKKVFSIFIVFALFLFTTLSTYAATTLTWVERSEMPNLQAHFSSAVSNNNKIYTFGGIASFGDTVTALGLTQEYDPQTNSWSTKASMPIPVYTSAAVTATNGKMYVIGGHDGVTNYVNTVQEYDPSTNTWSLKTSMPTPRGGAAAALGEDGKIYVFGGITITPEFEFVDVAAIEVYDPATDTWTTQASALPTPRTFAGATILNGKMYIIGGINFSGGGRIDTVDVYDPATDTWTTAASYPRKLSGIGVVSLNGKIYAMGGNDGSQANNINLAEVYDPTLNIWTEVEPMPTARGYLRAVAVNNKIYALGGIIVGTSDPENVTILSTVEEATVGEEPTPTPTPTNTPTPTPIPVPTSIQSCQNGGWMNFTNPSFQNQGQCIQYVNTH